MPPRPRTGSLRNLRGKKKGRERASSDARSKPLIDITRDQLSGKIDPSILDGINPRIPMKSVEGDGGTYQAVLLESQDSNEKALLVAGLNSMDGGTASSILKDMEALTGGESGSDVPPQIILQTGIRQKKTGARVIRQLLESRNSKNKNKPPLEIIATSDSRLANPAGTQQKAISSTTVLKIGVKERVMTSAAFRTAMGEPPKTGLRKTKYNELDKTLKKYEKALSAYEDSLKNGSEDSDVRRQEALGEIEKLGKDLEAQAESYLANSQSSGKEKKAQKTKAVSDLLRQVSNPNNHRREVERVRVANWKKKLNPLDESLVQAGAGRVLGEGVSGAVSTVTLAGHGRPNLPDPFVAAIKMDGKNAEGEARKIGIPDNAPEESKRGVATFDISRLLKMDNIPPTDFIIRTNKDTGIQELGQVMGAVTGVPGQLKKKGAKKLEGFPKQEALRKLDALENGTQGERDFEQAKKEEASLKELEVRVINGVREVFAPDLKVVNVNYQNPVIQKGLSDLQMLDAIIGAQDRHPGNWIYETAGNGSTQVLRVVGIDNDDTLGTTWKAQTPLKPQQAAPAPGGFQQKDDSSKTPGFPPNVDVDTAINILSTNEDALRNLITKTLQPEVADAAVARLKEAKAHIRQLAKDGDLASNGAVPPGRIAQLAAAIDQKPDALTTKTWGPDTLKKARINNSYLGQVTVRADVSNQDTATPVFP